jgi:S-DNA-T family DNA segregation ATPase FtsK/SpoIIIE
VAFYQLQTKKNKRKLDDKKTGVYLLIICSFAFIFLFTSLLPFMRSFLLGMLGLFSYPLSLALFFVAVALINQKKYVMPKRYVIFLSLVLISFLGLLQLMILGKPAELNFWGYLGLSYTNGITAGGILISLLTAPLIYILDLLAGYIFFSLALVISVALLLDYLYYLKKESKQKKPLPVFFNSQNKKTPIEVIETKQKLENQEKKEVKITLDYQLENQNKENKAKIKLGLLSGDNVKPQKQVFKPENLSEYIMTPPEVDLGYYSKVRQNNQNRIFQNFEDLKTDELPSKLDVKPETAEKFVYEELPEFINPVKQESPKKPFIEPLHDLIDKELSQAQNAEQEANDRADEILKDILDTSKPVKIQVDPIAPQSRGRRGFSQLEINGVEKEQKAEKRKKFYAKPPSYVRPSFDLLNTIITDTSALNQDIVGKRIQLESALELFKIPAKVIGVVVGPAVTRYEIEMPPGISVKKILAHSDDIALALAAKGDIRIEAPIPGKSAVGIEVPNDKVATVGIKDILTSQTFLAAKEPLTLALGKDINGEVKTCNLQKMPHLLVAGATNSGKSVCLNSIIMSLIYKTSPDDVKLILIDPKRVEFSQYNNIPHLLVPKIIVDSDKAINAFNWAIDEMERRFQVFMEARVRNIDEYNNVSQVKSGNAEKMPFIVIIVDELADLMMISKKEAEEKIMRLAQKARACGIHLILATQRPSVDVITGTIKANFPSRIAFSVTNFQDSRTILDKSGAEKLLGKGDMLYSPSDVAEPIRIQGCFVSTKEVQTVVDYIRENNDYDFDSQIEQDIFSPKQTGYSIDDQGPKNGFDPLMKDALQIVIENTQASISMLQRKLLIGFPRAARIIDQMEEAGYISGSDGSKPRSVFITEEELKQIYNEE